jgi:hypothetical protein
MRDIGFHRDADVICAFQEYYEDSSDNNISGQPIGCSEAW